MFHHADYRQLLDEADFKLTSFIWTLLYQGVCRERDPRYREPLTFEQFVQTLRTLNQRNISYIVSYDGAHGNKNNTACTCLTISNFCGLS